MSSSVVSSRARQVLLASVAALISAAASPALAQEAGHHDDDHQDEATEVEDVIVQATRSGRRIQDEPIRVEVIGRMARPAFPSGYAGLSSRPMRP